jgi:hypothetical protein
MDEVEPPGAAALLRPLLSGQKEYWDAALPGFCLRVSENGVRAWVLMARLRGKLIRFTLGRYPAIDFEGGSRSRARGDPGG